MTAVLFDVALGKTDDKFSRWRAAIEWLARREPSSWARFERPMPGPVPATNGNPFTVQFAIGGKTFDSIDEARKASPNLNFPVRKATRDQYYNSDATDTDDFENDHATPPWKQR